MADSFADLWNSSAPTQPTAPPPKMGLPSLSSQPVRRPQRDMFSMLSSSSAPSSRPITPSIPQKFSPKPIASTGLSGDAFSGLGGLTSSNAKLTIAQHAAMVKSQRTQRSQQPSKAAEPSAWDGLDALGGASKPARVAAQPAAPLDDDDWGLGDFGSAPVSAVVKSKSPSPAAKASLWDLDDFAAPAPVAPVPRSHAPSSRSGPTPRADSPSDDFDFGNRVAGLLNADSDEDDDPLGILGQPTSRRPSPGLPTRPAPSPLPSSRAASPPPHIVGQIVEMGFSPQQARVALAATDTGLDVQAALEALLSNGAAGGSHSPPVAAQAPPRRREDSDSRRPPSSRRPSNNTPSAQPGDAAASAVSADKIIAQASEIGLSAFKSVNAFWSQGKEKVQKAYEERTKAAAMTEEASGSSRGEQQPQRRPIPNGRPKWMQEETDGHDVDSGGFPQGGFSDDVPPSTNPAPAPRPSRQAAPPPAPEPEVDLFSEEPAKPYVSPFRNRNTAGRERPAPPPAVSKPTVASSAPKEPLIVRKSVSASPSALASAEKHKAAGGELFKLGQFGGAEAAYSSSIAALPEGHILLIPLYNNRALARLKTGDYREVVEDATYIVNFVGPRFHPSKEAKSEVDLGDALVKALKRRAEAWEGREKWEEAMKDWEAVAAADFASGSLRNDAVKGAGRCRRMNAPSKPEVAVQAKPKPKPVARPRPPPKAASSTGAVANLKKANEAAEAEDQEKHDLKDRVDARLIAWKGGKEANVRALIASLDTVLWPELGWAKIGMAELVMPNQVKSRYTRAIAKVHPDKLNAGNTTLEQRMIANGVFGALNEAWNAFKQ